MNKQILVSSKPPSLDILPPLPRPASDISLSSNDHGMSDAKLKDISCVEKKLPLDKKIESCTSKPVMAESNYFKFFDDNSLDFFDNSNEIADDDAFKDDILISPMQKTFSLEETNVYPNFLLQSIRFADDIIFTLNKSKILEISAAGLIAGIFMSLFYLPSDIGVGISLLLSAPLFVCLSGILAKFLKRKKR